MKGAARRTCLDGGEGQADAGELDADVVRAAVLDQPNLRAAPGRQLAQRAALRDLPGSGFRIVRGQRMVLT